MDGLPVIGTHLVHFGQLVLDSQGVDVSNAGCQWTFRIQCNFMELPPD